MSTAATVYGLLIAAIGFFLTRFTVTLAAGDTTVGFLFAGIVPLVLGLSLAAFGVILAVGVYDVQFVRTIALWCLLGTGTMLVLVVLTLLGSLYHVGCGWLEGVDLPKRLFELPTFSRP